MSKIVIALGGNALGDNAGEQLACTKVAAHAICDLIEGGHQVVIVHGNGPQVGMIKKAMDHDVFMPMAECIAMSQGYIGYHLQQSMQQELQNRGIAKPVSTVLTQVIVDESDPAFDNPTKPIGGYYDEGTAKNLMVETGRTYVEDAGRGWRWAVASPKPIDICEKETVQHLLDHGQIVVTCGGGGIPVINKAGQRQGVDAVIDKDFAAAKVAELIGADILFVLTAVDRVCIHYNQPNQQSLAQMTVSEALAYCEEGHFAPGSMLPKVEAGISFVNSGAGKKAIIGSLEKANETISGHNGTVIIQ